jgi:hypothetical protein
LAFYKAMPQNSGGIYIGHNEMKFICFTCGAEHDIDEISFGSDTPVQWALLLDAERSRSLLTGDQCEIEGNLAMVAC